MEREPSGKTKRAVTTGAKRPGLVMEPPGQDLRWIERCPASPYFQTDDGRPWHPIGQNDAVSWAELGPLYRRRDVPAVEAYLQRLRDDGVTVMRVMLEYAQVRSRYFETAIGKWSTGMVAFWDDLIALCRKWHIRLLLTPFDTFWMWLKFKHHPYNQTLGGPLLHPSRALLCGDTRMAIKARLRFAAERWGGSGVIFAWDLWNEIHPAHAEMSAEPFAEFIADLSSTVRETELQAHGRTHLQTVSLFGPELKYRPELKMEPAIFRHPSLDFSTIHIYEHGTIDDPRNTVDAAIGMGAIVRQCLAEIHDGRPFLDTEHGPIHTFKDKRRTLPAEFDDEYFRHMQWAHLASGGAGGGMRWPNRHPHTLTPGMRAAQHALSRFMPAIDWTRFKCQNISEHIRVRMNGRLVIRKIARFGCASADQAIVYLLRRDTLRASGRVDPSAAPITLTIELPLLSDGIATVCMWNTLRGEALLHSEQRVGPGQQLVVPHVVTDVCISIQVLR